MSGDGYVRMNYGSKDVWDIMVLVGGGGIVKFLFLDWVCWWLVGGVYILWCMYMCVRKWGDWRWYGVYGFFFFWYYKCCCFVFYIFMVFGYYIIIIFLIFILIIIFFYFCFFFEVWMEGFVVWVGVGVLKRMWVVVVGGCLLVRGWLVRRRERVCCGFVFWYVWCFCELVFYVS